MPGDPHRQAEVGEVEERLLARSSATRTEMRRPSSASVSAPTSGPKSSTEVNANTSETEKRASIDGTLSVSVPLSDRQDREQHPLARHVDARSTTRAL